MLQDQLKRGDVRHAGAAQVAASVRVGQGSAFRCGAALRSMHEGAQHAFAPELPEG